MSQPTLAYGVDEWLRGMAAELDRIQQGASPRTWTFDMDDESELSQPVLRELPRVHRALDFLQRELYGHFRLADDTAKSLLRAHTRIAGCAISSGVAAVLLAIAQLMGKELVPSWTPIILLVELLSVLFALVAVVLGVVLHYHHRWLTQRQSAERLRALKFEALGWHELWCDEDAWRQAVRDEMGKLIHLDQEQAEHWAIQEEEPWPDEIADLPCDSGSEERAALAGYYQVKRQRYQQWYFEHQARRADQLSWPTRWKVSLWIFYLSAVFVACHGLLAWWLYAFGEPTQPTAAEGPGWTAIPAAWVSTAAGDAASGSWIDLLHRIEILLIGMAAILPIVGFGLRAWISAFEFPRSRNLYRAKSRALVDLMRMLERGRGDVKQLMLAIRTSELFFLGEHREWCRLQIEAEWYF